MTTNRFEAGATFAGYRIEEEIGRGGMGVVYRALDLSLERLVALKLIAPELATDEGFRKRFLRESRVAASLDHPHVLPVFSAGEEDGHLYLAMRYVEGEDLKTHLRREGTLPPEQAVRICSQVAEALDAAHRRGLVHRDLKPANVLLDLSGEAYLADFGLTKQVGTASTETGQLVGTLDYLAPEQIRGEEIDGRTDEYALACVLYECLAGQAPFHRSTEAELLWAHMQEDPPALSSRPELDPVFRRALAKEKEERYESAAAFVEAAAAAIGLETPRLRRRRKLMRRSRLLLAAGALLLAGAAVAAGVAITRPSEPKAVGNAVAAIEPAQGDVSSYTATGTTPSNVVIGGGSVWVLNADDRTISRIDPRTRKIVKTFATGGVPTDLAFEDGSLWVGNGSVASVGLASQGYTSSVVRIDPDTYRVSATVTLPYNHHVDPAYISPLSRLSAYRGSVWAINPDQTVSRIDTRKARVVKRVRVHFANTIAAGREGVWVTRNASDVTRIDPRTGRIGQTISVPARGFAGIAVGAGSVWAASQEDGTVWRIEPGPHPTTRTIAVGPGVTFLAFADGAVWAANFIEDTVSRIDPRTNTVTSTTQVAGTPLGIAADRDLVWTSTAEAGGLRPGALPASVCGEVESGGKTPDLLIASDFPLQGGGLSNVSRSMADAIRFVLRRHGYRAGEYVVGYQSCDDSTAQSVGSDYFKCASNAKAYSRATQLVGLIGPYMSYCAEVQLPILNGAANGSVPVVSSSNTNPGLTRAAPGAPPGQPESLYPTGARNYLRVVPGDDLAGAANAVFAKQLGLRKVYVVRDEYVGYASGFTRAARRIGLTIAGSAVWAPQGGNAKQRRRQARINAAVARRVARSAADGVFLGGLGYNGGYAFLRALRSEVGREFPVIVTDGFFPVPQILKDVGPAALNTYVTFPGLGTLSPSGRKLWHEFTASEPDGTVPNGTYAPQTLQAAELMLAAIARSDGTRGSVLRELRGLRDKDTVLGPSGFDANGDVTPEHVTVFRITGRTPRSANLVSDFRGSVPVRVVSIPSNILD
jgi:DNA-binding beta-propeller fold protein YncE/ABC-type branched-subunit amino acid transport system substrate-binding protein